MARVPFRSLLNPYKAPRPKPEPVQLVNLGGNLGYARLGPPDVVKLPDIPPRKPAKPWR